MNRRRSHCALGIALLTLAACATEKEPLDGLRFACSADPDCANGYSCRAGECVPTPDPATADDPDAGVAPDAGPGAPDARVFQPDELCAPDAGSLLCVANDKDCGSLTVDDPCGRPRTVQCGSCSPPKTCGGGGTPNVCG